MFAYVRARGIYDQPKKPALQLILSSVAGRPSWTDLRRSLLLMSPYSYTRTHSLITSNRDRPERGEVEEAMRGLRRRKSPWGSEGKVLTGLAWQPTSHRAGMTANTIGSPADSGSCAARMLAGEDSLSRGGRRNISTHADVRVRVPA